MKKIFLMAAVVLSSVSAFAQHEVGSVTLQPKVGMNIANVTKMDETDPRIGLAVGAELEYQVTDIFSLSAGALYSMQGCKSDDNIGSYFIGDTPMKDGKWNLEYINVPIMANVYVVKGLAIKLGVQPGFNVNSDLKVKAGGDKISADLDAKTFDFSIPVGLSYEYENLVLDARYNWGLTKIIDGSDSKNSVFQITLGYKLPL
jgi:predicted porin